MTWVREEPEGFEDEWNEPAPLIDVVAQEAPPDTWQPVNLADALTGVTSPAPEILFRTDGFPLLYRARANEVKGEQEVGKGWFALLAAVQELSQGNDVHYYDFEDTAESIVGRLRALGVPAETINAHFFYFRPEEPVTDTAWFRMTERPPTLAIIDAAAEAYGVHGLNPESNPDADKFGALLVKPLVATGAAVLLIDHVTKDKETRHKYSIGAQHKLNLIDGASYIVQAVEPFGHGLTGRAKITVAKDKHGHVRGNSLRGRLVGELKLTANADGTQVQAAIEPFSADGKGSEFRPTVLMERVSRFLEEQDDKPSARAILDNVKGGRDHLSVALRVLKEEEYVSAEKDGKATVHTVLAPFRAEDDE